MPVGTKTQPSIRRPPSSLRHKRHPHEEARGHVGGHGNANRCRPQLTAAQDGGARKRTVAALKNTVTDNRAFVRRKNVLKSRDAWQWFCKRNQNAAQAHLKTLDHAKLRTELGARFDKLDAAGLRPYRELEKLDQCRYRWEKLTEFADATHLWHSLDTFTELLESTTPCRESNAIVEQFLAAMRDFDSVIHVDVKNTFLATWKLSERAIERRYKAQWTYQAYQDGRNTAEPTGAPSGGTPAVLIRSANTLSSSSSSSSSSSCPQPAQCECPGRSQGMQSSSLKLADVRLQVREKIRNALESSSDNSRIVAGQIEDSLWRSYATPQQTPGSARESPSKCSLGRTRRYSNHARSIVYNLRQNDSFRKAVSSGTSGIQPYELARMSALEMADERTRQARLSLEKDLAKRVISEYAYIPRTKFDLVENFGKENICTP